MISRKAEQSLIERKPINGRLIYVRFFSKYMKLSIIQAYAPTNEASDEDKGNFYDQLQSVVDSIHKHDILTVPDLALPGPWARPGARMKLRAPSIGLGRFSTLGGALKQL